MEGNVLYRFYYHLNYNLQDPKTADFPLMLRPFSIIFMLVAYNLICLRIGPRLMAKRKPFELRNVIIAFDFFQIVVNVYIFYLSLKLGWWNYYNWFCAEIEYEDNPHTREVGFGCFVYFVVKMTDLLDTIFMVLRKKNSHISFLHMYHHTGMVITTYINCKILPGGHQTCIGLYNSVVHVVMYSYYLYAALYPKADLYSFKKLVTKLQMIQFGLIALHLSTVLIVPNCGYPKWVLVALLPQNLLMFFLFLDFFRNTYVLKRTGSKKVESNTSSIKTE